MKTPTDPRHLKREKIVKRLFSFGFGRDSKTKEDLVNILAHLKKIDALIHQAAPEWPIEQINRLDLAILRLAIFELVIDGGQPPLVVIDEAIELAKKYGSEKSPGFVNGVLGTVLQLTEKKKNAL